MRLALAAAAPLLPALLRSPSPSLWRDLFPSTNLPPQPPPPSGQAFPGLLDSLLSILPSFLGCDASSNFTLSAVYGDDMVLQRGQPGRVWGWVGEGCSVTASLVRPPYPGGNAQPVTLQAERAGGGGATVDGHLPASETSLEGATLTFAASNGKTLRMDNVQWGGVIFCSWQSSMAGLSQHSLNGPGSVASSLTVEGVYVPGVFDKRG